MSHFAFLDPDWPDLLASAQRAEELAHPDPRGACFYARRTLELVVVWLYTHDADLRLPYQDHLAALLAEPSFQKAVGSAISAKAKVIKDLGNRAAHRTGPVKNTDAIMAVRELFHVCYWLARTYARGAKPAPDLAFDANRLPKASIPPHTLKQLQALQAQLEEKDARLADLLTGKIALDDEVKRLRAEMAAVKKANAAILDTHDYSEAETRDFRIDLLLREAGWPLDVPRDREFPVTGMPTEGGQGFVDYVLWGDDGKPLGLVEAKRTKIDPRIGQQQAKLYAECLEKQFGQRPVIFYSNGYEHHVWDDTRYPPRPIHGFLKKDELALAIQRRTTLKALAEAEVNREIADRYYQERSIRRVAESFERDHRRRALLVMATGAGKTRTVIALADLLMRCNWVKRVLFLADRVALVKQAHKAFTKFLPSAGAVNLLNDANAAGRVSLATYPTMMKLIDEGKEGERRFGPGHFDLVVIDEAHRSVYQRFRAIFEYFDSLLVGLTATPKDEIDRNTYSLFELEKGVPTDAYGLDEAVKDKFLVPPRAVSLPLKFQRQGIKYDDLSEAEKEQWDALEWSDDGEVPDEVGAEALNRWLFNKNTVDKVLEHLMTRGEKVAAGDRVGKTIIFAKNHDHAQFIADRFDANYPHLKGSFARVIDFQITYAQSLIEAFEKPDGTPHIVISVDMMDTGIDVPDVVNLVFFKLVRSKTKFWQMVGRGTRLRPDLYGPGKDKTHFWIFDYCQNLEFFSQDVPSGEGSSAEPLGKRLFKARLELIAELDRRRGAPNAPGVSEAQQPYDGPPSPEMDLRAATALRLRDEVAAMPLDNFIVRPKRRAVERFSAPDAWDALGPGEHAELAHEVAGLPSGYADNDIDAKQFDYLMLRLQLALLRSETSFDGLRKRVSDIAGVLAEKASIPMVAERMALIEELQTDEFWQDLTAPILETVRRRLRDLIKLIEKVGRQPVFSDFEDELGEGTAIALPIGRSEDDFERFKAKARHFLRERMHELPIQKLRLNLGLTAADLDALDRMLAEARLGTDGELSKARSEGLGVFVRSLVGLDRQAAMQAFGKFLDGRSLTADQQEFITMVIEELTRTGVMRPDRLFEVPFVNRHPLGVVGLFSADHAAELTATLEQIERRAVEAVSA